MNKRIKIKINKRGFSLVELLAAIVIVGVLSVLAIAGVTRYVDGARREKASQDKKSVSMAAQLYLQANRELYPKLIGDETRIDIADLKNKNYLKETITNDAGDSCMEKSFVRVYKLNEGEYSYTTYLYCGNEEPPETVEVAKPVVTNFKFTGGSKNAEGNFNDVKDAKFSFTMKGSGDDDTVGIYSYSYAIYVKATNREDDAYTQVFDSESIKGGFEPVITVTSKNLSSYMSLTGFSNIRVDVTVINEQGGKTDFSNIEGNYEDKQNPLCGTIEGQAENDNDWINKVSFGNKDAIAAGSSRTYPARISVDCSDGFGSGCKRDRFTRSWPNDYESVSGINYKLGTRWSYITLEDNSNNSTKCYVRANVDLQSPKVTVTFFKLNKNGSKGEQILTKTVQDQNQINATMPSLVINSTDFKDVVGTTDEKWMNADKYPYGITMDVAIEDNLYLYSYSWKTNDAYVKGGTGNAAIAATASLDNSSAEQGTGTVNQSTFASPNLKDNPTNDNELKNAEHGVMTGSITGLKIVNEGKRYGELEVCDKANNCTYVKIYANLDRTAPPVPNASYYKGDSTSKIYTPANKDNFQDNEHWTNTTVSVVIHDQKTDHEAPNNKGTDLSGWDKFVYKLGEQDTTKRNKFLDDKTGKVTQAFSNNGMGYKLTKEGIHRIGFQSCDKAGNCSKFSTDGYAKIDLTKPTCTINVTYNPKKGPNSAGWLKAGQSARLDHVCKDDKVYASNCNPAKYEDEYYIYDTDINTKKAGAAGDNKGGYVYDYAGNKSDECPKNETIRIDTIKPTCDVVPEYSGTKKPNAKGWLKAGQSVKLSLSCDDPAAGNGVKSKCDSNHANNKKTTTYNKDIDTKTAGAFGDGKGGTVFDIAGNESDTCPTMEVRIDTKKPTCTTKIIYNYGNPTSEGWLGNNGTGGHKQTATVRQVCDDPVTGSVSSTCDSSSIKEHTYSSAINTTTAGAGGNNSSGGKVKDEAGNESDECPKNQTVRIDYTNPTCTPRAAINSTTGTIYSETWTNNNVFLVAQCTDSGAVKSDCRTNKYDKYDYDKDATVNFTYNASKTTPDNSGSAQAIAYDKAGNYATCNKPYKVRIDKTAPYASCSVSGSYYTNSNQSFSVDDSSTYDPTTNGVSSGIKTKTYSLDGGSYSSSKTKTLACGSSARYAGASINVTDNAGNTASATCIGDVYVNGCCDNTTGTWYRGSCSASCGGGTRGVYQISYYNPNTQCNYYNEACNTQSCCSESNPYGCQWVTSCREGTTWVYSDYNLSEQYAVVRHNNGWDDKLFILNHYGWGVYIYAETMDKWGYDYTNYVYIWANCINQPAYYNQVCPYASCPG